jgi:hypothetical protein
MRKVAGVEESNIYNGESLNGDGTYETPRIGAAAFG